MKLSTFKIKYLLLALSFVLPNILAQAAKSEYTRTYTKTYNIDPDGQVNIENIHGQVNINTWDKSEVYIKVVVTVDASSERKAEDDFERIDIDFSNDSRNVSAKTSIDNKKSTWWFIQSWWDDDDIRIDYEVSMPSSARLELTHKYGNADLGTFSGDVEVNHKYGDLTINHVAGKLDIDVSYGNATIAKANISEMNIAYYKLRLNDANEVTIDSKYSQIYIESANEIISESSYDGYHLGDIGTLSNEGKYDNFEIEKIESMDIDTKYTKLNLEYLLDRLDAEMSYGGLEIDRLDAGFDEVIISSRYAGLEIDTDEVPSFRVDVEGRYTGVNLPRGVETTRDIKDGNDHVVVGYRGNSNAKGEIRVRAEYGGLKLR
ncbi:MAG: hypothetical protein KDC80_01450 [Saprospiraceae bacterium]|nr:hypothetical protein [Saprospiraceae bacterium]